MVRPLLLALAVALVATAAAQSRDVQVEFGFGGEIVAGAWNPVTVTLRDQRDAVLELRIDQGSLREGEKIVSYQVPLPGGTGIHVFEDDFFVPGWRSLVWVVRRSGATVASGSIGPRQRDGRPLELVVSAAPGRWRSHYPEGARVVEHAALALPERVAAYHGVHSLLIDGSAPPPRLAALAAAAAAGVQVVLLEPLPASHRELEALAPGPETLLGEGRIVRATPAELTAVLALRPWFSTEQIAEVLAGPDLIARPTPVSSLTLLLAAAGYGLLVLVVLRFGGGPGLLASLSLALLLSLAAWGMLRPDQALFERSRSVAVGAGPLAKRYEVRGLLTLPRGTVTTAGQARPFGSRPYTVTPAGTTLTLGRWEAEFVLLRPELVPAVLQWRDGRLLNAGERTLGDIVIKGWGPQVDLPPGGELEPQHREEVPLPELQQRLLELVPEGSALARSSGGSFQLALPTPDALARGEP